MATDSIQVKSLITTVRRIASKGQISEPDATNIIVALNRAKARAEAGTSLLERTFRPTTISNQTAMELIIRTARSPDTARPLGRLLGIPVVEHISIHTIREIDSLATSLPDLRHQLRREFDEADSTIESTRRRQLFERYEDDLSVLKSLTERLLGFINSDNRQVRAYATKVIKRDLDLLGLYLISVADELDAREARKAESAHPDEIHRRTVQFQHFETFYTNMLKQLEQYAKSTNDEIALHTIRIIEQGKFDPEILYCFSYSSVHSEAAKKEALEVLIRLFNAIAEPSTPERIKYTLVNRIAGLTTFESCPREFNVRAITAIGAFLSSEAAKLPSTLLVKEQHGSYADCVLVRLTQILIESKRWHYDAERTEANIKLLTSMLKSAEEQSRVVADSPFSISNIGQALAALHQIVLPDAKPN